MKVSVLELDCAASAIDIGVLHRSMDNQAPRSERLTANRYIYERISKIDRRENALALRLQKH
jgi:hypothetical protein